MSIIHSTAVANRLGDFEKEVPELTIGYNEDKYGILHLTVDPQQYNTMPGLARITAFHALLGLRDDLLKLGVRTTIGMKHFTR